MSCNHCNIKFNFFHKELGCSNCGLSFCSKCLKKGPNVCKLCCSKLSSGQSSDESNFPPPDKFLKRLENLQNPIEPPVRIYKQELDTDAFKKGLSAADKNLIERLEKIKNDGKRRLPTDVEIRQRLAKLKGHDDCVETTSEPLIIADRRTDQEKIDSLLEQFTSEKDIQLAHNPENQIEARLAALRGQRVRPNEGSYISDSQDSGGSEEEIDKITKKVMEEVALEEKLPADLATFTESSASTDNRTQSPELPWCVLCNNDAAYSCLDCDGDLYCAACNTEVHQKWGDEDHRVVVYKAAR